MSDNLELWKSVEKTDPAFTKQFKGKGGFTGTAICAQWQRYKATELWGPCGGEWGIKEQAFDWYWAPDKHDSMLMYTGTLFYPNGKLYVASDLAVWMYSNTYKTWSKNNDIMKKASTDALTKGLSMLGFSADVFMGKFDDNKYVQEMKEEFKDPEVKKVTDTFPGSKVVDVDEMEKELLAADTLDKLKTAWDKQKKERGVLDDTRLNYIKNVKDQQKIDIEEKSK